MFFIKKKKTEEKEKGGKSKKESHKKGKLQKREGVVCFDVFYTHVRMHLCIYVQL